MAYAIFETGGKQYRVREGDLLDVEKLPNEPGEKIEFDRIMLREDGDNVTFGTPYIDGVKVTAKVVDQFLGKKVRSFRFKRRKGFHKTKGHRQKLTRIQIEKI